MGSLNKIKIFFGFLIFIFLFFFLSSNVYALPRGAILYKTSEDGRMYGYNEFKFPLIPGKIYPGAVAIYIGEDKDGVPTIVEVEYGEVRKIPAKYFVDLDKGEKFIGAKIPRNFKGMSKQMAKNIIVQLHEHFDYTYRNQKGPSKGDWTSVGFVEKIYESAESVHLTYHQKPLGGYTYYSDFDITPDGFDDESEINDHHDCFSTTKEFSKIHKLSQGNFWERFILKQVRDFAEKVKSAAEAIDKVIGVNIFGRNYQGNRYFFFPYTQFVQPTLKDVPLDIEVASHGKADLPGTLSSMRRQSIAAFAFSKRTVDELFWAGVKTAGAAKLGISKIISPFLSLKESVGMAEEGIRFLTGDQVDINTGKAIKKVISENRQMGAALSLPEKIKQAYDAGWKEAGEIADLVGQGTLSGQEAEEKIEKMLADIDFTNEPIEDTGPIVEHFGEVKEIIPELEPEVVEEEVLEIGGPPPEQEIDEIVEIDQVEPGQEKELEKLEEVEKVEEPEEPLEILTFQSGDVAINEFVSNPDQRESEWIELYNNTNQTIDLSNWTIEDNTAKAKFLTGLTIESKSWFLLAQGQHFNFYLNNSGDIIKLKYQETVIDQLSYGNFNDEASDNALRPDKGQSLARVKDGQGTNKDKDDWSITALLTPGLTNQIIAPISETTQTVQPRVFYGGTPSPNYQAYQIGDVVINEIMYDFTGPDTSHEWIEIYNPGSLEIDLNGWKFYEAEINHRLALEQGSWILIAGAYAIIADVSDQFLIDHPGFSGTVFDSSFSLHNTSEAIALKDGQGNIIDEVTYLSEWGGGSGKTIEKQTDGSWTESSVNKGTPGQKNSSPVVEAQGQQEEEDIISPVITLIGSSTINLYINDFYTDQGATALDDVDGDITADIVVGGDIVDTSALGTYTTTYNVSDTAGNPAIQVIRTVIVSQRPDTRSPEVSITAYPDNPANQTTATFEFTADEIVVFSCQLNSQGWEDNCLSSKTYTSLAEGEHFFYLKAIDQANNLSEINYSWTIDLIFPSDVVINEFVADPGQGESEWVELYNNSNQQIDLNNWTIEDNTNSPKSLTGLTVESKSWLLLAQGQHFNFYLNNSGDIIKLKYNDGLIDSVAYGDFDDGDISDNAPQADDPNSVARVVNGQDTNSDQNDFSLTATPTSGAANVITEPGPEPEPEPEPELDTTAPNIFNVSTSNITYNSVTITWATDEASDSQVEYGSTTDYGSSTTLDASLVTSHSQEITGLNASTVYHYRVKSKDEANNSAVSGDYNFTTSAAPDTTPPTAQISGQPNSSTNQTTADITVGSEDVTHYKYKLDNGSYGNETEVSTHITLSGLSDGEHTIYVIGRDTAGNWQEQADATTYSWTVDTAGPVSSITDPGDIFNEGSWPETIAGTVSSVSDLDGVEIQLQKGTGTYYLDSNLVWQPDDSSLWITQGINLNLENKTWSYNIPVNLLDDDNDYFIRSKAKDILGNIQGSLAVIDFIFDKTPPGQITNLDVQEQASPLDLKLSWGEISNDFSGIDYYEIDWAGQTATATDIIYQLTGTNRTTYSFKVRAVDKAGNVGGWSDIKEHSILLQSLVISEIQVNNNEFVELYNPTNSDISLTDWYFTYYSSGQNWSDTPHCSKQFPSGAEIKTGEYYLIGVYGYSESSVDWQVKTNAGQAYSSGQLSNTAGSVVIYSSDPSDKSDETLQKEYIDALAWGNVSFVKEGDSTPPSVPGENQSLERDQNQDTDDNVADFSLQTNPSPQNSVGFIGLWLNGWDKRKVLVIDNTDNSNDLTDYQVKIEVSHQSGMQSDFSDIRFTSSSGQSILPYYRESYTEDQSAVFWVKVSSISKYSEVVIYQYYGNETADYTGNGQDVFVWFDDFETNRSSEYDYFQTIWYTQDGEIKFYYTGAGDYGYLNPKNLQMKNFYLKTKMKLESSAPSHARQAFVDYRKSDANNYWRFGVNNKTTENYRGLRFDKVIESNANVLGHDQSLINTYDQWGIYEIHAYETNHQVDFDDDNFEKTWSLTSHYLNQTGDIYLRGGDIDSGLGVLVDYLMIANYTQPEPTVLTELNGEPFSEGYSPSSSQTRSSLELSDWGQRKQININNILGGNATSTPADYPIKIEVDWVQGMENDFSDLRFTDSDKETVLDYWNESYVASDSAVFWVKIPSIISANSQKNIYLYYNNPSATYIGNGQDVFVWFDDFETYRNSEYNYFQTIWYLEDGEIKFYYTGAGDYGYLSPKNLQMKNLYLKTKMKLESQSPSYAYQGFINYRYQDEDNYWRYGLKQKTTYEQWGLRIEKKVNGLETLWNYDQQRFWDEWDTYEIWAYNTNHKTRFVSQDSSEIVWEFTDSDLNQKGDIYLHGAEISSGLGVFVDYLIISKYIQPEPIVSFTE